LPKPNETASQENQMNLIEVGVNNSL